MSLRSNFVEFVRNRNSKLDVLSLTPEIPNILDDDNNNNANETGNGAMQTSMVLVRRIRPETICSCSLRIQSLLVLL